MGHGNWLAWLKANVRCSGRQCRDYMRVAAAGPKLAVAANLREALKLLTEDAADEPVVVDEAAGV